MMSPDLSLCLIPLMARHNSECSATLLQKCDVVAGLGICRDCGMVHHITECGLESKREHVM